MQRFQQIEDKIFLQNGKTKLQFSLEEFLEYEPEYPDCCQQGFVARIWTPKKSIVSDGKQQRLSDFDGADYLAKISEYERKQDAANWQPKSEEDTTRQPPTREEFDALAQRVEALEALAASPVNP